MKGSFPMAAWSYPLAGAVLALALAVAPVGAADRATLSTSQAAKLGAQNILAWPESDRQTAYRNLDRIYPSVTVKAGARPRALPRAASVLQVPYRAANGEAGVDGFMQVNKTSGVLVLKDGKIVLEKYAFGRTPQDRWATFSVTKSIMSTLIGAALKDGAIKSLDDAVPVYVPELKGTVYDRITLRALIEMGSGVNWNEDYLDPSNDIYTIQAKTIVENAKGRHQVDPPGTTFRYNTGDANLEAVIVARAVGMPVSAYLSQKIWQPYGMEADARWQTLFGQEMGGGNIQATLRDQGRLGQFILENGQAAGAQVLPPDWVAEATRPRLATGWGPIQYGYNWWIFPDGTFRAIGIYGQTIYVNQAQHLVIVMNSAWPEADWVPGYARQQAFIDAVLKAVSPQARGVAAAKP